MAPVLGRYLSDHRGRLQMASLDIGVDRSTFWPPVFAPEGVRGEVLAWSLRDPRWSHPTTWAAEWPEGRLRLVVDPAIVGREVAWSAARVDLGLLDPSHWFEETRLLGAPSQPADFQDRLSAREVSRWQFYQRDAVLRLHTQDSGVAHLAVEPHAPHRR